MLRWSPVLLLILWLLPGPALAQEGEPVACAPLGPDTTLVRCPTLGQVEALARTLAREQRVDSKGFDPLPRYRDMLDGIAPYVRVTPVLFFGRPKDTEAEAAHFKPFTTRGTVRSRLWANPGRMDHTFWVITRRVEARHEAPTEYPHYILRDGYLYTEDPKLARRYREQLSLGTLFDEDRIVLQRGDDVYRLERRVDHYVYASGPAERSPTSLFLFDRLAESPAQLGPPAALDLESLRERHGIARFDIQKTHDGWAQVHAVTVLGDIFPGAVVQDGVRTRLLLAHPDAAELSANIDKSRAGTSALRALRDRPLGPEERRGGGQLAAAAGEWDRVLLPESARASYASPERFVRALDEIPDHFMEGDVLLVQDPEAGERALMIYQVDPILGRPIAFVDDAGVRPLDDILGSSPGAVALGRLRKR